MCWLNDKNRNRMAAQNSLLKLLIVNPCLDQKPLGGRFLKVVMSEIRLVLGDGCRKIWVDVRHDLGGSR